MEFELSLLGNCSSHFATLKKTSNTLEYQMHKNAKRKQCKPKTADSIGFQFKIRGRGKVKSNFDGNFNIINEDDISRRN